MTYHTDNRFAVVATAPLKQSDNTKKLVEVLGMPLDAKRLIENVMSESSLLDTLDSLSRAEKFSQHDFGTYKILMNNPTNFIQNIQVSVCVYEYIKSKLQRDRPYLYAHTGLYIEPIDDVKYVLQISFRECYDKFNASMEKLKAKKAENFVYVSRESHLHKCIVKYIKSMQRNLSTSIPN